MTSFGVMFRTLFSRFLLSLLIIIALPIIVFMMLLPLKRRYNNRFLFWVMDIFYWCVLKISFVPIIFKEWNAATNTYVEHKVLDRQTFSADPVIFVANHQSSLDVPLVGILARGRPHVWLARQELMKWKLLRLILPRVAIVVDTISREKAMRSLINLVRLVGNTNIDIMIFPEGARFTDDKVHSFYGGFVALAKMLKRKVVPVYITGANKVYPPNTFWVTRYPITVVVGKPFEIQEGEMDDVFKQRVYQWFIEQSER